MTPIAGPVLHRDGIDWPRLIRSEYLEMPGLHLTVAQARRLWGLDVSTLRTALDALVETKFLRCTVDGAYVRTEV